MDTDIIRFFDCEPEALFLYQTFSEKVLNSFPDTKITAKKTQINFANKYNFAFVSLPYRKVRGRPDVYIIVSFGLVRHVEHPRIEESSEPYPNRWTHHVIVSEKEEIDEQLMEWIREAYNFSKTK